MLRMVGVGWVIRRLPRGGLGVHFVVDLDEEGADEADD